MAPTGVRDFARPASRAAGFHALYWYNPCDNVSVTKAHQSTEYLRWAAKMRKLLAVQVAAGDAVCVDCGGPVLPHETWEVGHKIAVALQPTALLEPGMVGVSHRHCNRAAGATLGNKLRAKRRRANEFPPW